MENIFSVFFRKIHWHIHKILKLFAAQPEQTEAAPETSQEPAAPAPEAATEQAAEESPPVAQAPEGISLNKTF